jgi:hypothetical protein
MDSELTPLVTRIAGQAKKYKIRSDANHDRGGEWRVSDDRADAEVAAWLTALGMVVQDLRGETREDPDAVTAAGAAFLEQHWSEIGDHPAAGTGAVSR